MFDRNSSLNVKNSQTKILNFFKAKNDMVSNSIVAANAQLNSHSKVQASVTMLAPKNIHKSFKKTFKKPCENQVKDWLSQINLYGTCAPEMEHYHTKIISSVITDGGLRLAGVMIHPIDRIKDLCHQEGLTGKTDFKNKCFKPLMQQYHEWQKDTRGKLLGVNMIMLSKYAAYYLINAAGYQPTLTTSIFVSSLTSVSINVYTNVLHEVKSQEQKMQNDPKSLHKLFTVAKQEGPKMLLSGMRGLNGGRNLQVTLALACCDFLLNLTHGSHGASHNKVMIKRR